jgi:hypothetical protein
LVSFTTTTRFPVKAAPAIAVCELPELIAIVETAPAVNVTPAVDGLIAMLSVESTAV